VICFQIQTIIIQGGTFKDIQTKRSQYCKVKDLLKKIRKWQIAMVGVMALQIIT
jgi:hypothetical protein